MFKVLRHKADLSDFDNEQIIYENFERNDNGSIIFTVEKDRYSLSDTQPLIVQNDFDKSEETRVFTVTNTVRQGYVVKGGKRHWCYDGQVEIEGNSYEVDFVENELHHIVSGRVFIGDNVYEVKKSDEDEWKRLQKLTSPGKLDMPVEFEDLLTVSETYLFTYEDGKEYEIFYSLDEGYYFFRENKNAFGEIYYSKMEIFVDEYLEITGDTQYIVNDIASDFYVTVDGEQFFACRKVEKYGSVGNYLAVQTDSAYMYFPGERIIFRNLSNVEIKRPLFEGNYMDTPYGSSYYTIHNGKLLFVNPEVKLYGIIDGKECTVVREEEYSESGNSLVAMARFTEGISSRVLLVKNDKGLFYTTCYADNSPFQNESGMVYAMSGVMYDNEIHYVERLVDGNAVVNFNSNLIGDFIVEHKFGNLVYLKPTTHGYTLKDDVSGANNTTTGTEVGNESNYAKGGEIVEEEDDEGGAMGFGDEFMKQAEQMCALCQAKKNTVVAYKSDLLPEMEFTIYESEFLQVKNMIRLYSPGKSIRFNFGISCDASNELYGEIRNSNIAEKLIGFGKIVDMERTPYVPSYSEKQGGKLSPISEIRFNLHFRTRTNIDGQWELTDASNPSMDNFSSWYVNDFYWKALSGDTNASNYDFSLVNSSDLLGYLGFSDNDVYYHKKKLSKSFLRLAFYDSYGKGRRILGQSTIFVDENALFSKYISNMNNRRLYQNVVSNGLVPSPDVEKTINRISVFSEPYEDGYGISGDMRLDSRIVVKDLLSSESSSEGFRIYLYKDMANGLYEKTIYMKVEYNHAGYGKTIPFMMLCSKENGSPIRTMSELYQNGFENGVERSEKNLYEYIPVIIRYSEDLNTYVYEFPFNREENVVLNLFETKYIEEGKDDYKFA